MMILNTGGNLQKETILDNMFSNIKTDKVVFMTSHDCC